MHNEKKNLTGTPERNMLLAILERAILDYTGNDPVEAENAKRWIFEDLEDPSYEPFTFSWICLQLDLDPASTAAKIKSFPSRGDSRTAPWYMARKMAKAG